jgi:hypothetical protein
MTDYDNQITGGVPPGRGGVVQTALPASTNPFMELGVPAMLEENLTAGG